jgi:hypothetical protein
VQIGPISLTPGYTLFTPPALTTLVAGQSTTFQIQLDTSAAGNHIGQVSFGNTDTNENPYNFNITTTVLPVQILDNGDAGFSLSGDWVYGQPVGRDGDVHMAFGESFLPADVASWNFDLAAGPGQYRVFATWFTNPEFPSLFTDQARFEVSDPGKGVVRGTALKDQKLLPNDLSYAGSDWEELGVFEITGPNLLVKLYSPVDNASYAVADAIRIVRIGDLPSTAEIQVTANGEPGFDVPDGTGDVSFGTTDFHETVTKTFTISNTGGQALTLAGPVTVTGNAFTVVSQPAMTTIPSGQSTTFRVRMNAITTGPQSGSVSFNSNDVNEATFNFTLSGTVLSTNVIDDGDPGFAMSPSPASPGGWGTIGGPGREFDYKYNRNNPGVDEVATWTFNVTPGMYRVSTTWPFGFAGYDEAAPFTIFDGSLTGPVSVVGGRNINQKLDPDDTDYPDGFLFPAGTSASTRWERIDVVNITSDFLTVQSQADDAVEFVLADSILIDRLGDLPAGPEIVVAESNRNAAASMLNFGTTQLNHAVEKTFTITNTGTTALNITSPISIVGPNAGAFQLVSGPTATSIVPGGTSTFVVRMTAAYEGTKHATIGFATTDSDEAAINLPITGTVLNQRIIDDQDTAAGYSETGVFARGDSPIHYQGDTSFANTDAIQGPAAATFAFNNLSPGIYFVALTWFETGGNSLWADNTQLVVRDGVNVEGNQRFSQRTGPAGASTFALDGANWLVIGFFDFSNPTVTVSITNDGANGLILADGVMLSRVAGGVPPGNRETVGAESSSFAAPSSSHGLREASFTDQSIQDTSLSTAYWNDELEDVVTLLAEEPTRDSSPDDVSGPQTDELDEVELPLDLAVWA